MQTSLGASAKARSAEPCEPTSRGKEQCGAALRGHACDDISRIRSAYLVQKTTRERCLQGFRWMLREVASNFDGEAPPVFSRSAQAAGRVNKKRQPELSFFVPAGSQCFTAMQSYMARFGLYRVRERTKTL